jgi:multidrug efflux system outer membrane protein
MKFIIFILFAFFLSLKIQAAEVGMSFLDAIKKIESTDTRVESEMSVVDAAKADSLSKKALFLPSLSLNAAKTKNQITDAKYTSGEAVAKLNLFSFGADFKAAQAAWWAVDKSEAGLKKVKLSIQNECFAAILAYLVAKLQLELEANVLEIKNESLKVAREKFNKGLSSEEDFLMAQVEVANAESAYHDLVTSFENKKGTLVTLLGDDKISSEWPINEKNVSLLKQKILNRPSSAQSRPDLIELALNAKQQESLSSSAFRRVLPRLDLSLNRGFSQIESGKRQWETTATLNLTIPLFDRFSDYAAYSYQRSIELVAKNNLERAKKNMQIELGTLEKNLTEAQSSFQGREQTLKVSRKLYQSNFARFKNGRSSFNDLAQDQARFIQSEQLAIEGKKQLHQAFADLCFAQGQEIYNCFL